MPIAQALFLALKICTVNSIGYATEQNYARRTTSSLQSLLLGVAMNSPGKVYLHFVDYRHVTEYVHLNILKQ